MKNLNWIFIAFGAGVAYLLIKSTKTAAGAAAPAPGGGIFGTANRILGGATGGTATLPSTYGFRIPTNGILTGGGSGPGKGADGVGVKVDVSKLVNAVGTFFGGLFARKPAAADQDATIAQEREYQTAKAQANASGIGSGFDRFNVPVDALNPSAGRQPFFYTPPAQGPAPAGRSFALDTGEDAVADYTTIPEQTGGWSAVYDGGDYGSQPNENY